MRSSALGVAGVLLIGARLCAQDLYAPGTVHEVRLVFDTEDWRHQLDSLFVLGNDDRVIADLWIDGSAYSDVGVRFKGYSSYSAGRIKNPFNIKLDEIHPGQAHQGYDKLKLSNVIQDPSFLRETIAYELARDFMPASQASYANLYVNDTLIGLYTNVEDVGREFLQKHFGSKDGAFFKGNPPTVDINGANCDLSDDPGQDSLAYMSLYDIQSETGWTELVHFIDVLNNHPTEIPTVLNVDRSLWMHAFNYAIINFDSYVGYAQNYYLYRNDEGLWEPIIWDLNMSFASFRLTDASTYWNGFSVAQAPLLDPLSHHNGVSVFPRPLMRQLFADPTYRRMFLAHLRTIVDQWFTSGHLYQRALDLRASIDVHVLADTNQFYGHQAFLDNLDATVSATVDYPGIAPFVDARRDYLLSYPGMSGGPVISDPSHAPENVTIGEEVSVTFELDAADSVFLAYRVAGTQRFHNIACHDDGAHGDGLAGDGRYATSITAEAGLIEYYIYAENELAGTFSPQGAAHRTHTIGARLAPGSLVINEFMASNRGIVLDPTGASSDWVELYNASNEAVSTAGLHLSDDPYQVLKWALPLRTIEPHGFAVFWLDDNGEAGEEHANFKLEAEGGTLFMAYDEDNVVDQVEFGPQYPIYSTGRLPNGSGSFRLLPPSLADVNRSGISDPLAETVRVYPNPARSELFVIVQEDAPFTIQLFRADGKVITPASTYLTRDLIELDTRSIGAGHYLLQIRTPDRIITKPIILLP